MPLPAAFYNRPTSTRRELTAGCFVCGGSDPIWRGGNAQAVAARHHDATKHQTWCDVIMSIRYGGSAPDGRQTDIEDAIASASSGDAPVCAALTDFDAPAGPAAGVSAPQGRSSKRALAAAEPEHASP